MPTLALALPGFESILPRAVRITAERFANDELTLRFDADVEGRSCVLLGSVAPPDRQLLELLLAADTLRRHGAARIAAVLPYLGYARQDAPEPKRSLGIAWVGELLAACGVERVETVDIHSARAGELLGLPLASRSAAELFAAELDREDLRDAVVVAPDEGAIPRCRGFAAAARIEAPIAYLRKERTPAGVVHHELVGELRPRAVIVDDILDTGATLVSCCRQLRRAGVGEATVVVTHGLFTGEEWKALPDVGAERLYVSDTIPGASERALGGAHVVSVRPLIEEVTASFG